jgi:FlaA1/EpsC-like NDP-sugar epimerase
MFKDKTLLITGGTGSFGHAVLDRFLETDIGEIRIFSRDEKKQDDMRKQYKNDKIKFYIGDVRDIQSVKNAMHGVDYIFHAAALKQVPSSSFSIFKPMSRASGFNKVFQSTNPEALDNPAPAKTAAYPSRTALE